MAKPPFPVPPPDQTGLRLAIFDIDNCIADDEWRLSLIDWSLQDPELRYMNYHRACGGDEAQNLDVVEAALAGGMCLIFITARPEWCRGETEAWLKRKLPPGTGFRLMMRGLDDSRPSVAIKRAILRELTDVNCFGYAQSQFRVAYDDRDDILAMYRDEFGIDARRLAIHDSCAMTPPKKVTPLISALGVATAVAEAREATYSSSYRETGAALLALFGGRIPEITDARAASRLYLVVMQLVKLRRQAVTLPSGGHRDSTTDMINYAAMATEFNDERQA